MAAGVPCALPASLPDTAAAARRRPPGVSAVLTLVRRGRGLQPHAGVGLRETGRRDSGHMSHTISIIQRRLPPPPLARSIEMIFESLPPAHSASAQTNHFALTHSNTHLQVTSSAVGAVIPKGHLTHGFGRQGGGRARRATSTQ